MHLNIEYAAQDLTLLQAWATLSQSCGWWWPFQDVVFVSDRPSVLALDRQGRLHQEGAMAMQFLDGYGFPAHHGVRIPFEWGQLNSEHWKPEWFAATENQEQRRVLLQALGTERVFASFPNTPIHAGDGMRLVDLLLPNLPVKYRALSVSCPSTGRPYVVRVPPTLQTCQEAKAWTFEMNQEEAFGVET